MLYKDIYNIVIQYLDVADVYRTSIDCTKIMSSQSLETANPSNLNALQYLLLHKLDECRHKHPLRNTLQTACYSCILDDLQENKIYMDEKGKGLYLTKYFDDSIRTTNCLNRAKCFNFPPFDHFTCVKHTHSCTICHVHKNQLDSRTVHLLYCLYVGLQYIYDIWMGALLNCFQETAKKK